MIRAKLTLFLLGLAFAGAASSSQAAPDAAAMQRILDSIAKDPSFKVRMQAIRVLSKQLEKSGQKPGDEVFAALDIAASKDEEHLVRGLACFALGQIADARAKPTLEHAKQDPHAFVRAQAEEALSAIAKANAPVTPPDPGPADGANAANTANNSGGTQGSKRRVLVIAADLSPGVEAPPELIAELERSLGSELQAQAQGYTIVSGAQGFGFKLAGTIAQHDVAPQDGGANKITIGVKITISTVPENNLRHVLSAKASAAAKGSPASLLNVEQKVLRAAVQRAVKDSLAAISIE